MAPSSATVKKGDTKMPRTIGPPPKRAPEMLLERLRREPGLLHPLGRRALELAERAKHAAAEPKASGALRAPAASAWHMGSYPKPKTTPPGAPGRPARGMPAAKPPSNRAFHQDMTKSLADPSRGARATVPTR
jgi:hypothetical protein